MIYNYKNIIKEGMVIKNYQEMISLLQETRKKTHDKKERQEKEWHRYFDWTREGNKYIITEVYEQPRVETIHNKKGRYINYFGYILLDILRQNEGMIHWFKKQLFEEMRMKSYPYLKYTEEIRDKYTDIVDETINNIFESCVRQMQNKGLIKVEKTFEFMTTDEQILTPLTEDEQERYKQLEEDAYVDFAIIYHIDANDIGKIKKTISYFHAWDKYYRELGSLIDNEFGADIYRRIKITLVTDAVYDVDEKTVYDDLNNAINDRLFEIAEGCTNKEARRNIQILADLNCTTYEDYFYKVRSAEIAYEIFTDEDGSEYPVSAAAL